MYLMSGAQGGRREVGSAPDAVCTPAPPSSPFAARICILLPQITQCDAKKPRRGPQWRAGIECYVGSAAASLCTDFCPIWLQSSCALWDGSCVLLAGGRISGPEHVAYTALVSGPAVASLQPASGIPIRSLAGGSTQIRTTKGAPRKMRHNLWRDRPCCAGAGETSPAARPIFKKHAIAVLSGISRCNTRFANSGSVILSAGQLLEAAGQ